MPFLKIWWLPFSQESKKSDVFPYIHCLQHFPYMKRTFLNSFLFFRHNYEITKLMSDLKTKMASDEKKARKNTGSQIERPTASGSRKNGAFVFIVQQHKARAFVSKIWCSYIPLQLPITVGIRLPHTVHLKSRVGSLLESI